MALTNVLDVGHDDGIASLTQKAQPETHPEAHIAGFRVETTNTAGHADDQAHVVHDQSSSSICRRGRVTDCILTASPRSYRSTLYRVCATVPWCLDRHGLPGRCSYSTSPDVYTALGSPHVNGSRNDKKARIAYLYFPSNKIPPCESTQSLS